MYVFQINLYYDFTIYLYENYKYMITACICKCTYVISSTIFEFKMKKNIATPSF